MFFEKNVQNFMFIEMMFKISKVEKFDVFWNKNQNFKS